MLSRTPVTLPKLISFVLSFSTDNTNKDILETSFPNQIKSNDEFEFNTLEYGESRNINDLPTKLKSIFDPYIKDFIRCGIRKTFENETNLSLYGSILSLVIDNYMQLSKGEQLNYIHKLRDKLIIYVSNPTVMKENGYDKLGWVKKDVMQSLVQFKSNKLIIKLLADFFHINIFILNVVEDRIYVISNGESYDMFRKNTFLVFYNNTFEPLIYCNSRLLNYATSPVNKLITVDKQLVILMDIGFNIQFNSQFNIKLSALHIKNKQNGENNLIHENAYNCAQNDETNNVTNGNAIVENEFDEILPEDSDANAYITEIEHSETENKIPNASLVFKISPKMKLDELQLIAKKLNIDIEKDGIKKKTNKTKTELINEINVVLKKK